MVHSKMSGEYVEVDRQPETWPWTLADVKKRHGRAQNIDRLTIFALCCDYTWVDTVYSVYFEMWAL